MTIEAAAEKVASMVRNGANLESAVVGIVFKHRVGGHDACRVVDAAARRLLATEEVNAEVE